MLNLPKGVSYIFIAVVAGLLATLGIRSYVARKTYVAPIATSQVVVANADVSPGNSLSGPALKLATWPKELVPPQAASALNQVDGRVALSPISKGEPVLFSKLAPVGTAAGLSSLMKEDKRALTIRVDDVTGVAGFIHPGDKVDILADMRVRGLDESFSKTILQNIKVLSTGQIWEQKGGDGKPAVVNTVTLELTPQQSEVMNLASNEGKIRLVLRGRRNETIVQTDGVASSALFGLAKKAEPVKEPMPMPMPVKVKKEERTVEVIKGMERSKSNL